MKKHVLHYVALLLVAIIALPACQKQLQEKDNKAGGSLIKTGNNANVENRCRLLIDKGLSDGFIQAYSYNAAGLADEFHLVIVGVLDWRATMSYGERNEIRSARFFYAENDFYDIVFEYDKDKIVKETWYVPGTNTAVDGYVNYYNEKGQLVKRDEPLYEVYSLIHYDAKGNPEALEVLDYNGNLLYGEETEYTNFKNPFTSVTGLPESIFFTNDIQGPNRINGLTQYFLDDQGNKVVYFQWKSEETEIIAGAENYPVYQKSIDAVGGMVTDQTWTYENCGGNSEAAHNDHALSSSKGNSIKQLLLARKTNHYKQDLLNFRKAHLEK